MKQTDDIQILKNVIKGDAQAYSRIIDMYKSKTYTLAYRILRNREDAEEAVQDAFLKCYYSLPEFKFDSSFGTWLYRIVYTSAISLLRKRKNIPTVRDDEYLLNVVELYDVNHALGKFRAEEQKFYVNEALKALNEDENTMIYLYYQEDKSIEEISNIMEISRTNIKVKLFRARRKLFDELSRLLKKEVYNLV